ncbi:MAG: serine hydrolase domain-containing protein [Pseudomonadota bacterium]
MIKEISWKSIICSAAILLGLGSATTAYAEKFPLERFETKRVANWHYAAITPENLKKKARDNNARIIDIDVVKTSPLTFSATLVENVGAHKSGWWWYYDLTEQRLNALTEENNARIIDIDVYHRGDKLRFAALMAPNTGAREMRWYWGYDMTEAGLKQLYREKKMRILDIERYRHGGKTRFAAVLVDNQGANRSGWYWYPALSKAEVSEKLSENNMRLIDMERYKSNGKNRFVVVMMPRDADESGHYWWYQGITKGQLATMVRRHGARVVDIEPPAYGASGYSAILIDNGIAKTGHCGGKLAHFEKRLIKKMKQQNIPGAQIAVVKDDRLVHSCGIGQANIAKNEKVTPDNLFRIASITKLFTMSAIRKLDADRLLSLSDPMMTALGDRAPATADYGDFRMAQITVQHLLDHRGGWIRNGRGQFDPMFRHEMIGEAIGATPPLTCRQIMDYMLTEEFLDYFPGQKPPRVDNGDAYSNLGYCILGQITRERSGRGYQAYVRDNILNPAGARSTKLGKTQWKDRDPREVVYYGAAFAPKETSLFTGEKVDRPYGAWVLEAMAAHGGWISSANDLVRYAQFTPVHPRGSGNVSHDGALTGTWTSLTEKDGAHVAILLNGSPTNSDEFSLSDLIAKAIDDTDQWPTRNLWSNYGYPE